MTDTSKPHLERLIDQVAEQVKPPIPDARALNQFAQKGDSESFSLLVQRHGPMVLGVCQRILGNLNDAEDAFQATFLKLARGARSIYRPESLAAWLHRVARQTAGRLKSRRTRTASELFVESDQADPYAEVTWREVRSILDAEIARLPEELRLPLILCYLEGATRDEAACRLGWSLRTLMRRLQEARETLRERLTRQGLAPMGLVATILSREGLFALIPPTLTSQVLEFAKSKALVPDRILALSAHKSLKKWIGGLVVSAISIFGLNILFLSGSSNSKHPNEKKKTELQTEKRVVDSQGDPLPEGSLARLGTLRYRHPNGIAFSSLSKDGKRLATASLPTNEPASPRQILIWELPSGKPIRSFPIPSNRKLVLDFSATISSNDKSVVIVSGQDIQIYDIETGKEQKKLTTPASDWIHLAQLSSNSKRLYLLGSRVLKTIDLETDKEQTLSVEGYVQSISEDEKWAIVLNENRTTLIDLESGKPIRSFELIGSQSRMGIALSADKTVIALLGDNPIPNNEGHLCKIELRETQTGKCTQTLLVPNHSVPKAICFTPDKKHLFVAGDGLYGWNIESGQMTCLNREINRFRHLHPTPESKEIIATAEDGLIRRYDIKSMKEILIEDRYDFELRSVISLDGKYAAVSDQSGRLDVWDLIANRRDANWGFPKSKVDQSINEKVISSLAFLPNSSLLVTRQVNRQFAFWDMESKKQTDKWKLPPPHPDITFPEGIGSLAVSPDGRYLFSTDLDERVGLEAWDWKKGKRLWQVANKSGSPGNYGSSGIAILPDGKTVVQTRLNITLDGNELVWWEWDPSEPTKSPVLSKKATWIQEARLPVNDLRQVLPVATSACGRYLIVGDVDGNIRLWHPKSNKEIAQTKLGLPIRSLAFSPDGNLFASGGTDGKVLLWESATMQPILTRNGHTGWVTHLTFGPGGKTLLSSGHDATALYWDLRPKIGSASKSIWEDLASTDSIKAYSVIWQCVDDPEGTIQLFRSKRLPSPKSPLMADWITKLDAKSFAERELASKSLAEMGQRAEPFIREALSKNPSSETKERLEKILDKLRGSITPEELRDQRAIQILGMIGSPEAKALLEEWEKSRANSLKTPR